MAAATWATLADLKSWVDMPPSGGDDAELQRCLDVAQEQQLQTLDTELFDEVDPPEAIVQALLMRAASLYRRRQTPEGVSGVGDFAVVRVGRNDPDVMRLENPYRCFGFT